MQVAVTGHTSDGSAVSNRSLTVNDQFQADQNGAVKADQHGAGQLAQNGVQRNAVQVCFGIRESQLCRLARGEVCLSMR